MSLILADALLDLGRIALNPTKDRGWVDLDTTLLHHLGQITVADAVLAVPAPAQQDDLNGKRRCLNRDNRAAPQIIVLP
jgi:hypothetical protein